MGKRKADAAEGDPATASRCALRKSRRGAEEGAAEGASAEGAHVPAEGAEEEQAVVVSAEADDEEEKPAKRFSSAYTNRQRLLIIASRGITARYRHLLEDLKLLTPHHKKDSKLDSKGDINAVTEIAEFKSCNQIMYLECRKHQDLYMFLGASNLALAAPLLTLRAATAGKTPSGPSVKFHVVNIHTMDELKLTGNCMKGSRPLLNFDAEFNSKAHWQVLKSILSDAFGTPKGHPKSKPFLDRVMSFFIVKNNICTCIVSALQRCLPCPVSRRGAQLPGRAQRRAKRQQGHASRGNRPS